MILPLFLIPVISGLLAQGLKPFLNKQWYATIEAEGKKIPRYGGMPSAHTSFATSLVTTVAFTDGMKSASFAIAVAILIFILDDALRMRIFLSRHGQALHYLVHRLPPDEQEKFPYLETRLGHRLIEAIAGAAVGIVSAGILLFVVV